MCEGSEAVYKLLFLDTRAKTRSAASLVASGPSGNHGYTVRAYTVHRLLLSPFDQWFWDSFSCRNLNSVYLMWKFL